MKETGVTRKLDRLGRIVIPIELRELLGIKEGDMAEFYVEGDRLFIKRHSKIEKWEGLAKSIVDYFFKSVGLICVICDQNKIVSSSKDLYAGQINPQIFKELNLDTVIIKCAQDGNLLKINDSDQERLTKQLFVPIVFEQKINGAVIVLSYDQDIDSRVIELAKFSASLLVNEYE